MLWFRTKRYGYGWTPATWQAWAVLTVYIIAIVVTFRMVDVETHSASDTLIGMVVPFLLYSAALIIVCILKGEKPRWRWGK